MSQSELPPFFPPTEFIANATEGMHPLGVDLVRAVYVGQFFGQHNPSLTEAFGAKAALEVEFWLPHEKRGYSQVRDDVDVFFAGGGSDKLAAAALQDVDCPQAAFFQTAIEHFTTASWEACRNALPSQSRLDNLPPMHTVLRQPKKTLRELLHNGDRSRDQEAGDGFRLGLPDDWQTFKEDYEAEKGVVAREWEEAKAEVQTGMQKRRAMVALNRDFIAVDMQAINEGSDAGLRIQYPTESFFREAVLLRRQTGTAAFNLLFSRMQDDIMGGLAKPELKALRDVWSHHHKEEFLPPEFKDAAGHQSFGERFRRRVIRHMLSRLERP